MSTRTLTITQLTAVGVSESLAVQEGTVQTSAIVVGAIGTNVVLRIEGSLDGTNYGSLRQDTPSSPTVAGGDITITENGTYLYAVTGFATKVRLRLVSIDAGNPTVDCVIASTRVR